ncbi:MULTISPECIES: envelope stress response membrane protein PspB [Alteromonas]|jgi:phage shock protein B|uniref:Envelope stress response membrane protein PspB n=2 Tax=Alteromonas TaxID=226 RepID=A0AAW7Z0V3_9ALTE|nr:MULTISPECIES: envelope stress response membrane protein PspB [Alteromonas]AMJ90683.1 phage shock protein B [Alteromonas sp. Mac2]MBB68182.1 envelope stress response membrane protein PspB [Rickettsiales bacterium]AEF04122.1 phage shock protein B [Alteromonas naphthalenivorans]ALM91414.1 Phage shock protein B [Alteromonas stellipolaris LMG 21856]AMJ74391.1 phage shock protein B [Alteromonas stellipolaris]|tara:strand:+ start:3787 stop:4026 length:240 start_codon:yes stop_codon:yes gene_type:complete|mmetsp:Transcript_16694/g.43325  ORF Transcript_16694/g.43325 Transcript_16694/m.43325 type:complete len:80 (+) Transcript_16694:80-319(+)
MDEGIIAMLVMPLVIFMIFVAPIWLILHYRSKKQVNQGLSVEEQASLQSLAEQAEKMSDRIQTLEAILDSEAPEWRNRA